MSKKKRYLGTNKDISLIFKIYENAVFIDLVKNS